MVESQSRAGSLITLSMLLLDLISCFREISIRKQLLVTRRCMGRILLTEGGSYKTPRTPENVAAACKAMGLDDLPEKDRGERKFYVDLVYELWVLFDDKLRAIAGVEIDLDLGGVKPFRAHPYRWSPTKVQAGRELAQEFLDGGIVRPITSEWGAPALLVPKPKGGWRLVIDLRELNKHIPHDVYDPPSCDLCLE